MEDNLKYQVSLHTLSINGRSLYLDGFEIKGLQEFTLKDGTEEDFPILTLKPFLDWSKPYTK